MKEFISDHVSLFGFKIIKIMMDDDDDDDDNGAAACRS